MLKKILIAISVIVALVLIAPFFRSGEQLISREQLIAASPETLFPYINNSQKSYSWMPWAESDPGVEVKFSGPAEGMGSKSSWNGKQMGEGMSEVVESIANQSVKTKLEYTKPFAMTQMAEISLTPSSSGTLVKWSVSGHASYICRLMGLFVDMDKMVGGEFEKGLAKLKSITEKK